MVAIACGLLALGVVAFLISPLLDDSKRDMQGQRQHVDNLLKRKDFLYSAIRELNIDYNMGKLSAEDHKQLQSEYMTEASGVLDQLEHSGNGKQHVTTLIEQAVLDIRQKRAKTPSVSESSTLADPQSVVEPVPVTVDTGQVSCDACGTDNEADANFCIECGISLRWIACEACGENNKAHAKFCATCGETLV
jgi:hypothetical protein